jgi:hemerythrin
LLVPVIEWNESLMLDQGVMDETHKEFVELLNRLAEVPAEGLLAVLDEFIAHSEVHFAQEQRWMAKMDFPPLQCHVAEHESVMQVAREVRVRTQAGETRFGPVLAQAVAEWFTKHATSMDAVLSLYMKEKGFVPDRDPVVGVAVAG